MISSPFHLIGRKNTCKGCAKFVNILKGPGGTETVGDATLKVMTQPPATKIQLINTPEYRENYANSVQVRVNLWDFFLMFGRVNQTAPDSVAIHNFQGVYVSPQQAKALLNVLRENVSQYEAAFGEIRLEPQAGSSIVQ
jgi:flagellar protein FlaG